MQGLRGWHWSGLLEIRLKPIETQRSLGGNRWRKS